MDDDYAVLENFIGAYQWREASAATRRALLRSNFALQAVRAADVIWTRATGGRFGFSAHIRAVGRPPPGPGKSEDEWAYAILVGKTVGWHDGKTWSRWDDVEWNSSYGATLPASGKPDFFRAGCFPFHDSVVDFDGNAVSANWLSGFSPRDCWGESVWSTWCRVWRAVPWKD